MVKIVCAFYNAINIQNNEFAMPAFYEAFFNGLKNNGNELLLFPMKQWSVLDEKCPLEIKNKIQQFAPDLVILFILRFRRPTL